MTRLTAIVLVALLCATASTQQLPSRDFTPDTLFNQLQNPATEKSAQVYLVGAYDLMQDSGQSCAVRGTTTPAQLEKIFSNYLQAHPELMHADRTAAGVAAQAFAEFWPCQNPTVEPRAHTDPTTGPQDAEIHTTNSTSLPIEQEQKKQITNSVDPKTGGPGEMTIQVQGAYSKSSSFGTIYRTNVIMPMEFNDNGGHWSLTCEHLLSHGSYKATYEPQKNKIKLLGLDMKGKPQTTKCEVFTHDWRHSTR